MNKDMPHNTKFLPLSAELNLFLIQLQRKIKWNWVKSHQNDTSISVILNNKAYEYAQRCRKGTQTTPKWPYLLNNKGILLHNEVPIMNNDNIITSNAEYQLLFYYSEKWNIRQN